jgi:hypothetical protein
MFATDDRPDLLLRFLGAGVDYLSGTNCVCHFGKVPHIRGGIGIEHYDISVHSLLNPSFVRRLKKVAGVRSKGS